MRVVVASHRSSMNHDTGPHHPERPQRIEAVRLGIVASGVKIVDIESPSIERSDLALVHDPSYISMIEDLCAGGGGSLDMDTVVSTGSWEAALHSAGAVKAVIETMSRHEDLTGFALTRPPGHHASSRQAMGFCLFNNVAIGAKLLRAEGARVAILDWDVHHGNGTQRIVAADPEILYASIHQSHFYPFNGFPSDIEEEAKGTTINIPVPAGTAGDAYRRAWGEIVLPIVAQFDPDWVLLSAGYDAHADDMLANLRLEASDYGWMAARLSEIHPPNRIVVALEGGYDLTALRECTAATIRALAGVFVDTDPERSSPDSSFSAVDAAAVVMARYWDLS